MLAVLSEQHLVVGYIAGLDAGHATPRRVAEISHGGCFLGPGIPDHGRSSALLLDHDMALPPAIFDDASPWRIEVDAVGLRGDGDELGGLQLAPCRVGLVDIGSAREPGDRDVADV